MPQDEEEFGLPEEIHEGLKGLYEPGSARGMEDFDAAVLGRARRAGEAASSAGHWRWRRVAAVGIAAAVAVTVGVLWQMRSVPYARTGDIRDAYYLARQLKAHGGNGAGLEGAWDVNKDGVVDERDVRALAMAAVRVSNGLAAGPGAGREGNEKGVSP